MRQRGEMGSLRVCEVMECGVDWITLTVRPGMEQRALARLAEEWALDRSTEGYALKGWRWNNYVGSQTDGISYGKRDDGWILRLSGSMALRHWLTGATWAHNISRFDLQTTILDTEGIDEHAARGFSLLALDKRIESGFTTSRYIESTPDGSTLYVGSRSSDRMLRLYDKTAESEGDYPKRCWRYEIEYKGERAQRVAQRIRDERHETQAIFDALQTCYSDWGIGIPAPRPAWIWRDVGVEHTSDDQRRIAWLRRCIRPVVERLSIAVGVDATLAALGIQTEVDELTGEIERTILPVLVDAIT